jgi:peptidoglycan hydrolase-like protein with peptidoglycan-binding domain
MAVARGVGMRTLASVACSLLMAAGVPAMAQGAQPEPEEPSTGSGAVLGSLSLIPWYAAPSLVALRKEVDARWPGRSRSSDGVIGDTRHAARTNSHNPVGGGGGPRVGTHGAVHAMDITSSGIEVRLLLSAVVGDPRVWYVIHDGQIWSRTTGWAPVAYRGDPHTTHVHVNLREDSQGAAVASESDTRSWFGNKTGTSPAFLRNPAAASTLTTEQTIRLQRALIGKGFSIPAGATGKYGAQTTAAVAAFQQAQGWSGSQADGIAGPETLRRLGVSGPSGASAGRGASAGVRPAKASKPRTPAATVAPVSGRRASTARTWDPQNSRLVYDLQNALIAEGYSIPAGPTGYFGTRTRQAVAEFQRSLGFRGDQADGIPGAQTLRHLGL